MKVEFYVLVTMILPTKLYFANLQLQFSSSFACLTYVSSFFAIWKWCSLSMNLEFFYPSYNFRGFARFWLSEEFRFSCQKTCKMYRKSAKCAFCECFSNRLRRIGFAAYLCDCWPKWRVGPCKLRGVWPSGASKHHQFVTRILDHNTS